MIDLHDIIQFAMTYPEKTKAFIIDERGLDHPVSPFMVTYYIAEGANTIKIEGIENITQDLYPDALNVHCFISRAGAPSFPEHTDDCDVRISCIEGIKTMEIEGVEYIIRPGNDLSIPKGTPHRATNRFDSVMLSIGY